MSNKDRENKKRNKSEIYEVTSVNEPDYKLIVEALINLDLRLSNKENKTDS
ncbi:hypothetical protein [Niallia nealsonii]|uniref:hypothetical protein n=1 Tax=Niallia nealsonii TaxID=115979 RepID=UPI0012FEF9A5|nr:hypothetical protein [Niallia nealsonii]